MMVRKTHSWLILLFTVVWSVSVSAQDESPTAEPVPDDADGEVEVAAKVEVDPKTADARIEARLYDIMFATDWFQNHEVDVNEGVVVLTGNTDLQAHKEWAEQTAMRTSDVVAVINRIQINERPVFDLEPANRSLQLMIRDFVTSLPLVLVALVVMGVFYFLAKMAAAITRKIFKPENDSKLLRHVVATVIGVMVFLIGLHIALRIFGSDSFGNHIAWRHRIDRIGDWFCLSRHRRKFSRQYPAQFKSSISRR